MPMSSAALSAGCLSSGPAGAEQELARAFVSFTQAATSL